MDKILAVDVGTQSLRACVFDRDLTLIEKEQIAYFPQVKSKKRVEIEAEILWDAFIKATGALKQSHDIKAISFATLCPSLLPMDAAGNPLSPIILHLDRRSYQQAMWALERVGKERFLQIAGNLPIPGGVSCTSLLWLRDHEPDVFHRKDVMFGHAVTFFMRRLTGKFLIDPSNASLTGLYNTQAYSDWDEGILRDLEIPREKLPDVALSTDIVGELDKEIADQTGLPRGIPVVIGANDTTCATVGAGVTESGKLMNTSGTVEIMVLCLDRPFAGENHLLRTSAYLNRWLAMKMVGAGGGSLEWFRRTLCPDMNRETFYNDYLAEVLSKKTKPEARFYPYLTGDRQRIPLKTASFTRLTLNTTREDMLLALAYGIVSFQTEILREWQRNNVPMERQIYHVGGGASEAYTQYKQRLLKDFEFVQLGETAMQGAAILAFDALAGR